MKIKSITGAFLFSLILAMSSFALAVDDIEGWTIVESGGFVRNATNGTVVHGHQFGIIASKGLCTQELLWLTLSSSDKHVADFSGQDVVIKFSVGDVSFETSIAFLSANKLTPELTVMVFSNFVMGEKFITLLEQETAIEVEVVAPASLVEKLDINGDVFSLANFVAARARSHSVCAN
jgi:hypothetical protein